jgi:hypothetical protein
VDTSDNEFSQFPVESIARFLAVCGNEDPALLRRSTAPHTVVDFAQVHMRLPPPLRSSSSQPPPAGGTSDQSEYLEELVAIAVSSARQAEDNLQQIRAASAITRRRLLVVPALSAIGLALGIASMSGVGSSLAPSGLFPKVGTEFASGVEHQSPDPDAVVVGHPPSATASATQPSGSRVSERLPDNLAMMTRAAEPPPLVLASAQATPAKLTEHQSPLEAILHENAARDAGAVDGAPTPMRSLPGSVDSGPITRPEVQSPLADARSASAAARVRAVAPSKRWQLIVAVQALEALINATGGPGARPSRGRTPEPNR